MARSVGLHLSRSLALLWSALAIFFLLAIAILILHDPKFPLKLGSINTVGRTGLWVTLLPGLLGFIAVLLVLVRRRAGAWLLSVYSLFWTSVLIAGLPAIWNARTSFCTRSFCITTPWLGRSLLLALAAAFLLVALWAYHDATRRNQS